MEAADALEHSRRSCIFRKEDINHRRGKFPALATGISYGGGQARPKNRANEPPNECVLNMLTSHAAFRRIAGFSAGKPHPPTMSHLAS